MVMRRDGQSERERGRTCHLPPRHHSSHPWPVCSPGDCPALSRVMAHAWLANHGLTLPSDSGSMSGGDCTVLYCTVLYCTVLLLKQSRPSTLSAYCAGDIPNKYHDMCLNVSLSQFEMNTKPSGGLTYFTDLMLTTCRH